MVVIRLARGGAKKTPFYHIVVADSRKARGGRFIERLGFYNPLARGQETTLQISEERVTYWVNTGAQPSERVAHILKLGVAANKTQPKKSEVKTAQIDASRKAAAAKAKVAAETTEAAE